MEQKFSVRLRGVTTESVVFSLFKMYCKMCLLFSVRVQNLLSFSPVVFDC